MKKIFKKIRKTFIFIGLIFLMSWIIKAMFISIYLVPSGSMYPTIKRGDFILVIKFPYQLRTPDFYPLLQIPFPYYRISGPLTVNKNDVLVFNSPVHTDMHPSLKKN